MVAFDWLLICYNLQRKVIGYGLGLLQPAKKSDQLWLGLISFGLLQPAKKSDWVWLGLIGLVCYNLQRKVIRYGWV